MRSGHRDRLVKEQARRLELGAHVGDLPLQALQVGERPPADDALVHVADGVFQGSLRGAQAHGSVATALVVEMGEQSLEGLGVVGIAGEQDVVGLDAHVVEGELGLGAAPQPHLFVGAGDAHSG